MAERIAGLSPELAKRLIRAVDRLEASGLLSPSGRGVDANFRPPTPIYIRNTSGAIVPPFACVQAVGTIESGGQNYLEIDQPADVDGTSGGYLFNGPFEIEIGGNGVVQSTAVVRGVGDGSVSAAGDRWSPIVSSWEIEPASDGIFVCVGDDDIATDVVRVFANTTTGGGAVHAYTPVGGIPARSGLTMGSATCDIFDCGVSGALSDSGTNEAVYNVASSAVSAETHIVASRNAAGLLVVIMEDCG